MTACISLSLLLPAIPQIPPIFTSPLDLSISFPPSIPIGKILCCKFTLPTFTLPIHIPAPIPPAVFQALNALIQAGLIILPTIDIPICPGDGETI